MGPRATARIALFLRIALFAYVPVQTATQALVRYVALEPDPEQMEGAEAVLALLGGVSACCLYVPIFLALVVLFPLWFACASSDLRAAGVRGMRYTPGWAAGWFFVPLANLVKPYQVAAELWRASAPLQPVEGDAPERRTWKAVPVAGLVIAWWIAWVAMNVTESVVKVAEKLEAAWPTATATAVAMVVLRAVAALLAERFVRRLQARVAARTAVLPEFEPRPMEPWN